MHYIYRIKFILIVTLCVVIAACDGIGSDSSTTKPKEPVQTEEPDLRDPLLKHAFDHPDFIVESLQIEVNGANILFNFHYRISPKLYKILSVKGQKFFLALRYPDSVGSLVKGQSTSLIECDSAAKGQFSFNVKWEQRLIKKPSQNEKIMLLKKHYDLEIYDKNKVLLYIDNDIDLYQ